MQPFSSIKVAYEDLAYCASNKEAWGAKWTKIFEAASK